MSCGECVSALRSKLIRGRETAPITSEFARRPCVQKKSSGRLGGIISYVALRRTFRKRLVLSKDAPATAQIGVGALGVLEYEGHVVASILKYVNRSVGQPHVRAKGTEEDGAAKCPVQVSASSICPAGLSKMNTATELEVDGERITFPCSHCAREPRLRV